MALDVLQSLIDKTDTVEAVRDQIALILATERDNQKRLATQCGRDASLWAFDVCTDRSNPFEKWLNDQTDDTPIVSVWFDSANFDKSKSDAVERQHSDATFNIDCYALGVATDDPGAGHVLGDEMAAREALRVARLVRNILMASINIYLQKRGLVGGRWVNQVTAFQPQFDNAAALQVAAVRIILNVAFNEFSPQYEGEIIEQVAVDIQRSADGFVLAQAYIDTLT